MVLISEITNRSRKVVKQLTKLYISYTINPSKFNELLEFIIYHSNSNDADIVKEITLVSQKLQDTVIDILSNKDI